MRMDRPALALLLPLLGALPLAAQAPDHRPAPLPEGTVAWIAWHDGARVFEGAETLTRSADLPARVNLALGLGRAALVGATGGIREAAAAHALSPKRAVLGLALRDGSDRPRPYFLAERDPDDAAAEDDLDQLLERLPPTAHHARDARWLVVTDDRDFTAEIHESLEEPTPRSDTGTGTDTDQPLLHGRLEAAALRRTPTQREPGSLYLVGPLQAALADADGLDFTLALGGDGVEWTATLDSTPLGRGTLSALLPHADRPRALPPRPEGTVAILSLDRSLAHLIRHRDDLLRSGEAAQLAGGLTIADALSGGSFVDGILAALDEPATLFVVAHEPQENDALEPRLVDLPSFVVVAPLRDGDDTDRAGALMERAFGNLMLADGTRRRQQELPSFLTRVLRGPGGAEMLVGEPIDWRGPEPWPIETTLSPTLSVAFDHAVLASTAEGARRALQALADAADSLEGHAARVVGDFAELDPTALASVLERNLDLLVFDEVMKKGVTPDTARRELGDLFGILRGLGPLRFTVEPGGHTTRMVLSLEVDR